MHCVRLDPSSVSQRSLAHVSIPSEDLLSQLLPSFALVVHDLLNTKGRRLSVLLRSLLFVTVLTLYASGGRPGNCTQVAQPSNVSGLVKASSSGSVDVLASLCRPCCRISPAVRDNFGFGSVASAINIISWSSVPNYAISCVPISSYIAVSPLLCALCALFHEKLILTHISSQV